MTAIPDESSTFKFSTSSIFCEGPAGIQSIVDRLVSVRPSDLFCCT